MRFIMSRFQTIRILSKIISILNPQSLINLGRRWVKGHFFVEMELIKKGSSAETSNNSATVT